MKRFHKYNAKPCEIDGIKFPSKREAEVYAGLKVAKKFGKIKGFKCQVRYDFVLNNKKLFFYKADFVVEYWDHIEVLDAKGFKTPMYKLKKKLIEAQHNIKIVEV